ncbi:hypothetical protein J1605_016068 [Eschrichtius robustus]|uniref:Uncharacterized protein n=1 Tax=Eschrichtius robustus TaxID=9764 RepID=A0AB34G803_ESCRO|nr:hypothetical protein J1605_016068 [Eschrichtius robustus]
MEPPNAEPEPELPDRPGQAGETGCGLGPRLAMPRPCLDEQWTRNLDAEPAPPSAVLRVWETTLGRCPLHTPQGQSPVKARALPLSKLPVSLGLSFLLCEMELPKRPHGC